MPGWRMGGHGRDHPYRICWRSWRVAIRRGFRKDRRSGIRRRRHLSYTLWAGMENRKTWPMAETILSYLLAELESSNPQRISQKASPEESVGGRARRMWMMWPQV